MNFSELNAKRKSLKNIVDEKGKANFGWIKILKIEIDIVEFL